MQEADARPFHEAVCESITEVAPFKTAHPGYAIEDSGSSDVILYSLLPGELRAT